MSGGVFWGFCDLIMILGSLCANGWGCVPVLLVVWHRVSSTVACWSLSGDGSWRWDGDLWKIVAVWYYVQLGGLLDQCPELGSPTSEAQAWHPAGAARPCQPHGFWEVSGFLPVFSRCSVGVVPHVDVFLMYLWVGGWSPRLTPPPSWSSSCIFIFISTILDQDIILPYSPSR